MNPCTEELFHVRRSTELYVNLPQPEKKQKKKLILERKKSFIMSAVNDAADEKDNIQPDILPFIFYTVH